MDNFAKQPDTERRELLSEAANRRDSTEIIMEKDLWVCWTLKRLFTNPKLSPHLTFKGGTSLSKSYSLIERFSEDIDLTINRAAPYLKDGQDPMEDGISNKERARRIKSLGEHARHFVKDVVLPALQADIGAQLGDIDTWHLSLDPEDPDQQTLLFHYPKVFSYGGYGSGLYGVGPYGVSAPASYIRPQIKLEFGARGEIEPNEKRPIKPYAAEEFPDLFENPVVEVSVLAAERTFWEKATILHALYHGAKMRDRMSRHYYDTFMLSQRGIAKKSLQYPELLTNVVKNKSLLFRDAKASYETAHIGALKLLPTEQKIPALRQDYARMDEMFMTEYPSFDEILNELKELEDVINSAKS